MELHGLQQSCLKHKKCFTTCYLVTTAVVFWYISMLDFVKNISTTEIIVIALILVMLFGAKFVTGLAKTSGESLKEIKKIKKNFTEGLSDESSKDGGHD